jgi:hypothetical protein
MRKEGGGGRDSRQSARLFLQSSESAPQPQEMVSTPFGSGGAGGGGTLACGFRGSLNLTELM